MSEAWDGKPPGEAAERDGWHWVWDAEDGEFAAYWHVSSGRWTGEYLQPSEFIAGLDCPHYLGPAALPAEVAAREAAARREGMLAAAEMCDALRKFGDDFPGTGTSRAWARAAESLSDRIRAAAGDAP